MKLALEILKKGNEYRTEIGGLEADDVSLVVTAIAQIKANCAAKTHGHPANVDKYITGENLAWGYAGDPYVAWVAGEGAAAIVWAAEEENPDITDEELNAKIDEYAIANGYYEKYGKEEFAPFLYAEAKNASTIGHYSNHMHETKKITGVGYTQHSATTAQEYLGIYPRDEDTTYTQEEYEEVFMNYYNKVYKDLEDAKAALAAYESSSSDASKALEEANTKLEEAQKAYDKAKIACNLATKEYDISKLAYDTALNNYNNKLKELEEYKKSITYTLTYNPNGGTVNQPSKTLNHGSTYGDLPTPNRDGYTFIGWYTSAEGGDKVSKNNTISQNTTIYAHWTKNKQEVTTITMYRLYNPNSGEHFYTSDTNEKDTLISLGWNNEGIGWIAPSTSNTPVYRLYNQNGGEHHYTTDKAEKEALVKAGWEDEGIGWYSDDNKGTPLYRLYNPNAFSNNHHYTTDTNEKATLISYGWRDEKIGWYGVK